MPLYEMSVIVKSLPKGSLVQTVKRVAESVMDQGGYLRKIESLGSRELPYKMKAHGRVHQRGSYFLLHFDAPATAITDINDTCVRDVDLVRRSIFKVESPPQFECTLSEEVKPPVYRSEVQKMIEEADKSLPVNIRKKFKMNTGLDYYPFGH
ncbi:small ribosomal subunit protein bS6m-like [Penaeus indicus]|uniref:small ribosomal subunit protein bS6m-like n=1 Tax=Penaeus indicus TaxID=29960 RepID=UPI00300DB9B2